MSALSSFMGSEITDDTAFATPVPVGNISGVASAVGTNSLDITLQSVHQQLSQFANLDSSIAQIESIYDVQNHAAVVLRLDAWRNNIFTDMPGISILEEAAMNGAQGAYSTERDEIYLAQSLFEEDSLTGLSQVLLEEYGHSLDAHFNPDNDTVGDEGELFSYVISGGLPSDIVLARILTEDDTGTVVLNGQTTVVENSSYGVDFNQDTHPDILWRDPVSGQNAIWFMGGENNSQVIGGNQLVTVNGSWEIKGSTDFNKDNSIDLLWRDPVSGQNIIWFMDGANSTSAAQLVTVGGSWDIKGIADFNNDAIDDLVWRDTASGQNIVWLMGGVNNGESQEAVWLPALSGDWDIKGVADFNNDDQPDLLWRNPTSGQNFVWFMGGQNSAQYLNGTSLSTVSGSWDIEGIADFNNDNAPDVVWRDPGSGQNFVWFMGGSNNATPIGSGSLPTLFGNWQPILSGWRTDPEQPDLAIQSQTAPTSIMAGDTFNLSAYVKNQGAGSAGASTLRYYLSNDTTWDASDRYLGSDSVASRVHPTFVRLILRIAH
jgi:hypothetical protein